MHRFHFHRLGLCDEQGETPTTASGGTPETSAPALTIGQQLKAALSSKASLTAKIAEHEATITAMNATVAERDASIADLNAKLDAANAQIADLNADAKEVSDALAAHQAELTTLKADKATIEEKAESKAKEKVAALGFPSSKLPKADSELSGSTLDEQIEELNKKIAASSDPKEKGALSQQAWDLMKQRSGIGAN